jgi:hypothetical protein
MLGAETLRGLLLPIDDEKERMRCCPIWRGD